MEHPKFDKLIEHEHRITLAEAQIARFDKSVDRLDQSINSDTIEDSAIARKLAKTEEKVAFMQKIMLMAMSTLIFGIVALIIQSFLV